MSYWLMKSEPAEVSIDDLAAAKKQTTAWFGVRNYLARNYMREMKLGDRAFFYHSSCPEPGIAGIAQVASACRPDPTQFEHTSPYFDAKASPEKPRWLLVDVKALRKTRLLSLAELRATPALADLLVLKKGSRLSITPVGEEHWRLIVDGLLAVPCA